MSQGSAQLRAAIAARDAAVARVRRSTAVVAAGCVALGGTFAALASASTHTHHIVKIPVRTARRAPRRIVAPAPPLVAVSQAAAAPAPQSSAPAPVAAPPAAPPVAVSGGS